MEENLGVQFTRTAYIDYSGQAVRGAFKVLPQKQYKPKSFVIGTQKGKLTIYKPVNGFIHGEGMRPNLGKTIQNLELGGWGKDFRDRIFLTEGSNIQAITKRNVTMFHKNVNFMNQMIRKMWVEEHLIWLQSDSEICEIYSKSYSSNTERNSHYYSKTAKINDFLVLQPSRSQFHAISCADDKHIRIINKSESAHEYQVANTPIQANIDMRIPWVTKSTLFTHCTVGLDNGKIMGINASKDSGIKINWYLDQNEEKNLEVFKEYDISLNGKRHIICGLQDGKVTYFNENINGEMDQLWSGQYQNEKILDLEGGQVSNVAYNEFLVSNHGGRIYGLGEKVKRTTNQAVDKAIKKKKEKKIKKEQQDIQKQEAEKIMQSSPLTQQKQIEKLNKEIEALNKDCKKLEKEKVKTEKDTITDEVVLSDEEKTKPKKQQLQRQQTEFDQLLELTDLDKPQTTLNKNLEPWVLTHEISGNEDDGSLEILLISENPINFIGITSDMKEIEFVKPEENEAILATNTDPINQYSNCAYNVVKDDLFEYIVKLYVQEGQQGNLKLFVTCHTNPNLGQHINIFINSLYMHKLLDQQVQEEYLLNNLTVRGDNISSNDLYFWLNASIPDFEMQADDDFNNVCFENPFTQTYILVKIEDNTITFHSDSIQTIFALKKIISDDTNMRGKVVDTIWDVQQKSLKRNLKFIRNKLRELKQAEEQKLILDGLKDLKTNQEEEEFLTEEFLEIWERKDEIERNYKQSAKNQEFLYNMVIELYSGYSQLKGVYDYKNNIEQLRKLLEKSQYKQIFNLMNLNEN